MGESHMRMDICRHMAVSMGRWFNLLMDGFSTGSVLPNTR